MLRSKIIAFFFLLNGEKALALLLLVVVEEAKFEIVDLPLTVEVNLVEEQLVVVQVQVYAHEVHTSNEFAEVQNTVVVAVEGAERLSEPFEFLVYTVAYMLKEFI